MKKNFERKFHRRDLLRLAIAGSGALRQLPESASSEPIDLNSKRRTRYNPDSEEVRNFYRVNSGGPPHRHTHYFGSSA